MSDSSPTDGLVILRRVSISDLTPAEYNPRTISDDALQTMLNW